MFRTKREEVQLEQRG